MLAQPQALADLVESKVNAAVSLLASALRWQIREASSHRILLIEGWNDNAQTREAVAHYLVGLRADAVTAVLQIRALLDNTVEDKFELKKNIYAITGSVATPLSEDQINKERNPWIAEGIWHLCLFLAKSKHAFHPPGVVHALTQTHVLAKDHGLDVMAIYFHGETAGVSLVETKAYVNNPSQAVSDAAGYFRQADDGDHDLRIRQAVSAIRPSLEPERQKLISGSFWKQSRSYLANPHYDSSIPVDWSNNRPSFSALKVGVENIYVMPHSVDGFLDFFDKIASEMQAFADSL